MTGGGTITTGGGGRTTTFGGVVVVACGSSEYLGPNCLYNAGLNAGLVAITGDAPSINAVMKTDFLILKSPNLKQGASLCVADGAGRRVTGS
jgi:hypothetical protein